VVVTDPSGRILGFLDWKDTVYCVEKSTFLYNKTGVVIVYLCAKELRNLEYIVC
jgi:hypothetical protein